MQILSKIFKCRKTENKKSKTDLEGINQTMQSIILSDVNAAYGCNEQEVEVAN